MTGRSRFQPEESDALVTVFEVPATWSSERPRAAGLVAAPRGGLFTDEEGRHYRFVPSPTAPRAAVAELQLAAGDLDASVAFYRDVLDLELLERADDHARFATGTVPLRLVGGATAADGRRPRHHTYLIVWHAAEIEATREALVARGLAFKGPRVGFSEIGGTIRFDDPSGHRLCLYVPSRESLTWGSGAKVMQLAGAPAAAAR
jgi:predicted enzyme related to lactoylglutathione lyase